jgi:hypothetical protein
MSIRKKESQSDDFSLLKKLPLNIISASKPSTANLTMIAFHSRMRLNMNVQIVSPCKAFITAFIIYKIIKNIVFIKTRYLLCDKKT